MADLHKKIQEANNSSCKLLLEQTLNDKNYSIRQGIIREGRNDFLLEQLNETVCDRMTNYLNTLKQPNSGYFYLKKYEYIQQRPHFEPEIYPICELRYKV